MLSLARDIWFSHDLLAHIIFQDTEEVTCCISVLRKDDANFRSVKRSSKQLRIGFLMLSLMNRHYFDFINNDRWNDNDCNFARLRTGIIVLTLFFKYGIPSALWLYLLNKMSVEMTYLKALAFCWETADRIIQQGKKKFHVLHEF